MQNSNTRFQSYLVGLWFSLRTHASQIWQNPQQLLHPSELPIHRLSLYNKSANLLNAQDGLSRKPCGSMGQNPSCAGTPRETQSSEAGTIRRPQDQHHPPPPLHRRVSYSAAGQQPSFSPVYESVDQAVKSAELGNVQLGGPMTRDDFTRAVTVATVSALRHQQQHPRRPSLYEHDGALNAGAPGGHGGHDAPSWSRTTSASVLLGCTALYAVIAGQFYSFSFARVVSYIDFFFTHKELLVDAVDEVLQDWGIDEKFLGLTLFALVPNTTEFMNAISFALNGNIALRYFFASRAGK